MLYSCRNSLLRQKSPCFDRKSPSGNSCCWTCPLYTIFKAAPSWSPGAARQHPWGFDTNNTHTIMFDPVTKISAWTRQKYRNALVHTILIFFYFILAINLIEIYIMEFTEGHSVATKLSWVKVAAVQIKKNVHFNQNCKLKKKLIYLMPPIFQ